MRATIGDATNCVAIGEHLADNVEVAGRVVFECVQQQGCAAFLEKQFQSTIEGVAPLYTSLAGDAVREFGLVVGRVTQLEGSLQHRRHVAGEVIIGKLFDQPPTKVLIAEQASNSRWVVDLLQRLPQRMSKERVPRGL